jgi:hypothetical protein
MTPALSIVAGMLGVMLFFSFALAPLVFRVLPPEGARAYLRAAFPLYFVTLGIAALAACAIAHAPLVRGTLAACALLFAISRWWLTPRINAAQDAGRRRAFGWLHGASVLVNLGQIGALFALLWHGAA